MTKNKSMSNDDFDDDAHDDCQNQSNSDSDNSSSAAEVEAGEDPQERVLVNQAAPAIMSKSEQNRSMENQTNHVVSEDVDQCEDEFGENLGNNSKSENEEDDSEVESKVVFDFFSEASSPENLQNLFDISNNVMEAAIEKATDEVKIIKEFWQNNQSFSKRNFEGCPCEVKDKKIV